MARKYRQTGTVATVRIGRAPAAMRQEIGAKEGNSDALEKMEFLMAFKNIW